MISRSQSTVKEDEEEAAGKIIRMDADDKIQFSRQSLVRRANGKVVHIGVREWWWEKAGRLQPPWGCLAQGEPDRGLLLPHTTTFVSAAQGEKASRSPHL